MNIAPFRQGRGCMATRPKYTWYRTKCSHLFSCTSKDGIKSLRIQLYDLESARSFVGRRKEHLASDDTRIATVRY